MDVLHHPQSLLLSLVVVLFASLVVPHASSVELQQSSNNNGSHVWLRSKGRGLGSSNSGCNLFQGKWVFDNSFPLYESSRCPFIDPEFDCQKYGRPDKLYLKFAWKPDSCSLPRFNGAEVLGKWRGKKIMLVGDSLSENQWMSWLCLIHASVPNSKIDMSRKDPLSHVTFLEYDVTIFLFRSTFLVDIVQESKGRILKLDLIQQGENWKGMDVLVFNSWHWWLHKGKSQPWDYIQYGSTITKDMDRLEAYSKGMTTWGNWVAQNVDISKTKVYFLGISPTHYQAEEWKSGSKDCRGEKEPISGSTYPAGPPPALGVLKKVLSGLQKPVYLLDITTLSQLRKDAHPSTYSGEHSGTDCSHWCLAGLPDIWNQLLYAAYIGT